MSQNHTKFKATYYHNLKRQREIFPHKYNWEMSQLDNVVATIMYGLWLGTTNIQTPAILKTCHDLHIQHSIKAIQQYITC